MDFPSLSRRDLQALCKLNKIPANMTNIAMADALQSLQHVEGLEDVIKSAGSETPQSPERTENASHLQEIPRSVCRTSTRTKAVKEPESAQTLTRTRGRPRTKIDEKAPHQTPTVARTRRGAPVAAASACKNNESVACSTRRSLRLAEKEFSAMSLNKRGRTKEIRIDDLSKEEITQNLDDDKENKNVSESSMSTIHPTSFIDQNSNEVVKTSANTKNDVLEDKAVEMYYVDVKSEMDIEVSGVKEIGVEVIVAEGDDFETKQEVRPEATEEPANSFVEKLEGTLDENLDRAETLENKVCDDLPVTIVETGLEISNDDIKLNKKEDLKVDQPSVVEESGKLPSDSVDKIDVPGESEKIPESLEESVEPEKLNHAMASITETESVKGEFTLESTEQPPSVIKLNKKEDLKVDQLSIVEESGELPSDTLDKIDVPGESEKIPEIFSESVEPVLNLLSLSHVSSITETESVKEEFSQASTEQPPLVMKMIQLISSEELKGDIPFSNWAIDPLMGHVPRPTQVTPKKPSRMNDVMNINKENIMSSGGKMVDIVENNKTSTPLDKKSLRKLAKMLKSKLEIESKSNSNDNKIVDQKPHLGKSRLALQALPENNNQDLK